MYDLRVAKGSNKIPKFMGETVGAYVTCEGGSVLLRHGARVFDKDGKEFKHFDDDHDRLHFENFIDAVRSHDRTKLHAEILEGHISAGICHTGNISLRLGKKASAAEIRNVTQEIPVWNEMFERFAAHLKANEVDVDSPTITLGPWLETVPGQERFKDNAAADALAKGSYRAPYTVPDLKT